MEGGEGGAGGADGGIVVENVGWRCTHAGSMHCLQRLRLRACTCFYGGRKAGRAGVLWAGCGRAVRRAGHCRKQPEFCMRQHAGGSTGLWLRPFNGARPEVHAADIGMQQITQSACTPPDRRAGAPQPGTYALPPLPQPRRKQCCAKEGALQTALCSLQVQTAERLRRGC